MKYTISQIGVKQLISHIRDWWWFNSLLLIYINLPINSTCSIRFLHDCCNFSLVSLVILFYLWIYIWQSNFLRFIIFDLLSPGQAVIKGLYSVNICNKRNTWVYWGLFRIINTRVSGLTSQSVNVYIHSPIVLCLWIWRCTKIKRKLYIC